MEYIIYIFFYFYATHIFCIVITAENLFFMHACIHTYLNNMYKKKYFKNTVNFTKISISGIIFFFKTCVINIFHYLILVFYAIRYHRINFLITFYKYIYYQIFFTFLRLIISYIIVYDYSLSKNNSVVGIYYIII